jgi:hypothetical protein
MVRRTIEVGACTVLLGAALAGCAPAGSQPGPQDARTAQAGESIEIPVNPPVALLARERVATGLANPRGMQVLPDGSLLVSLAGTGDPAEPLSGSLVKLTDADKDGDFDDPGERTAVLDKQPSRNLFNLVRRDEVFGLAGMAEGGGELLVSLADFGGPSKIFKVDGDKVVEWSNTHGNVNDLDYDKRRKAWVGVASTTDEVVELAQGKAAERVIKFPPLKSGQDAVPAYLRYDDLTGDVLVTLFSGSPEGEEGGQGVELIPRAASVMRVHAETHSATPLVEALTVPTDLEIGPDGSLYVLEFCDAFLEPITSREQMFGGTLHGGFRRFSGRLLRIDRKSHAVSVVAQGQDAPTNLAQSGGYLYIAEGMGTPGRAIPGPDGKPVQLTGYIERLKLPN